MVLTTWWLIAGAWGSGAQLGQIEACDFGVAEACRLAAEAYLEGDGATQQLEVALELFARACELGSAESCLELADRYEQGLGMEASASQATEWFGAACELGTGDACRVVADYHTDGTIPDADPGQATAWYRRGCDHGDPVSCMNLVAVMEATLPNGQELPDEALAYLVRACRVGWVDGCMELGHRLQDRRPADAPEWFAEACELGDLAGCREYGLAVVRGASVRKDRVVGRRFLTQACVADDVIACAALGELLKRTEPEAALDASSRACGLGDDKACRRAWKLRRKVER